jgi:hypothetical protein
VAQNFGCTVSIRENVTFGYHSLGRKKKFFYSEDGGSRFIQNVGTNVQNRWV